MEITNQSYTGIVQKVRTAVAEIQVARSKLEQFQKSRRETNRKLTTIKDCQELSQIVAQGIQQRCHAMIAKVVTKCLETIFDEPYTFQIVFERKRGKTEAKLVFERDGMEIDPMTASGGGVLDVASFALRLSAITLTKPHSRKIIVMDEPFRFLSEGYREKVKNLLEDLSKEYGFQFIMVTHIRELVCGQNIDLG